jgi:hypothetical protein
VGFHAVGVRGRLSTCRIALALALAGLAAAPAAHGYTFGAPAVRAVGPEVTVFDYSTSDRCNTDDIPDQPARAFRNAAGQVVLIDTHHAVRRFVGTSLATVTRQCPTIMTSGVQRDPALYDDREWLATTYTHNGSTIYGLIHAEYQGWQDGGCGTAFEQRRRCWYNAITLTRSDNGGATFAHAPPPAHYVAGPPYTYQAGMGPIGFFQPSNIVRARDGFYYVLVHVEGGSGVQPTGSCLWRTSDLADPGSWRAWGGSGFTVRFRDPYVESYPPAAGVCALVARNQIGTRSESLTWSTYLKKWVLVGSADNADGVSGPGFYYHTSDDLINWTRGKLLMQGPLPWAYQCGGPEVLRDPSLLDDDSETRNFETIGQRPYLFFTRFHLNGCAWSLDRDLIRIPVEFSNRQPGGPVAVLNASTRSPRTGQTVTFDAGGSQDDGEIVRYIWDLDGDGAFEVNSGTNPAATKVYGVEDQVTVTLRVCDDEGKATDETTVLDVTGADVGVPPVQDGPTNAVCPAPPGGNPPGGDAPTNPPADPPPAAVPPGGDGGQGGAASGAPAAATEVAPSPAGRVRLAGKPRMGRNGRIALVVRVPAAGRLTVRDGGRRPAIRTARRNASGAGKLGLTVRPSRAGRALLRKKGRARVKLALVFRPVAGRSQRSTHSVTLRRAR